jgi:biopolymer transport protein ExbD
MNTETGGTWSPSKAAAERRAKRRPRYLLWIDMWPFVAVMLTLLICFVTFTPPYHPRSVDLPITHTAAPQPGALREDAIKVTVSRDGNIFFRDGYTKSEFLPAKIRMAVQEGSERKVYLKVDARAKYGDAERVVDQIRTAGIQQICILTEKYARR